MRTEPSQIKYRYLWLVLGFVALAAVAATPDFLSRSERDTAAQSRDGSQPNGPDGLSIVEISDRDSIDDPEPPTTVSFADQVDRDRSGDASGDGIGGARTPWWCTAPNDGGSGWTPTWWTPPADWDTPAAAPAAPAPPVTVPPPTPPVTAAPASPVSVRVTVPPPTPLTPPVTAAPAPPVSVRVTVPPPTPPVTVPPPTPPIVPVTAAPPIVVVEVETPVADISIGL